MIASASVAAVSAMQNVGEPARVSILSADPKRAAESRVTCAVFVVIEPQQEAQTIADISHRIIGAETHQRAAIDLH